MADYDGGRIFLQVVPSFRNVQRVIAAEAKRWGAEGGKEYQQGFDGAVGRATSTATPGPSTADLKRQGTSAGSAFADSFRRRVEAAARSLPPIRFDADMTEAQRELRGLRAELEALADKTVGVDIDSDSAMARVASLQRRLGELNGDDADVQVRADTMAASTQLSKIDAQLNHIDGQDARAEVHVDTDFAEANLNSFTGRLILMGTAAAALGPAIVPAAGAAAVALAGIGSAALVGLGGIGALVIGLRGVGDAVKALGEQHKNAAADAQAASEKQLAAARSLESAQRQLANAERGLANARATAADQAEQSARRIAEAQEAVADAVRDAGEAAEDSARRVADAQRDLSDAIEDAAEAAERAQERIAQAQQTLDRAMRDAAEAAEDMERRVSKAQEAVADATEDAARDIERALERQEDAEQDLARSQRDTQDAQDDLTQSRKDAAEALEDLELATRAASLAEEDAAIALARAQGRYAEARDEALQGAEARRLNLGVEQAEWSLNHALDRLDQIVASDQPDPIEIQIAEIGITDARAHLAKVEADRAKYARDAELDLADAELSVRQAELRVDQAAEHNIDIIEEAADARLRGVDGAEQVLDAERRVQDARAQEIEAAERLANAEQEINRVRLDGAEKIADAQERYTDLLQDQDRQQRDAAERQAELQRNLADAVADRADQEEDSNRRIADAQLAVTDALRDQQRQQVDSAERIEDAQQRVTDAIRAQETQQRQSAMAIAGAIASVEGAQAAVAAAVAASATEMSTSAKKAQEAMDALGPAGQRFAEFLFGLKPIWEEFKAAVEEAVLPGMQRGIENMLSLVPTLTTLMVSLGEAVGTLFEEMGASLSGADWAPFFDYLNETGADTLLIIGRAFGDLALTFANLMVAFGPLTEIFIKGFGNMAETMAEWSRTLSSNQGFQGFLAYLRQSLPQVSAFLGALGGAFVNIIRSMAPFGPMILGIVTGFLNMIASMPPEVLSAIALSLIGIVSAMNLINKSMDLFKAITKANPWMLLAAALAFLAMTFINAYKTSEDFRNIVDAALKVIGDTAKWLWEKAFKPAFDGIAGAVKWIWNEVFKPNFDKVDAIIKAVGSSVTWWWEKAIKPAFGFIWEAVRFLWDNVYRPYFGFIIDVIKAAGGVAAWLWEKAVKPAFDGIAGALQGLWSGFISPLFGSIKDVITGAGNVFTWLWDKAVKPAIKGIADIVSWLWNNVIEPTARVIGGAISGLGGVFSTAVDTIKTAWDRLSEIAKAPVRFIVNTVLNDGLIEAFNFIARALPGIGEIGRINLPRGFATGGIYPGYTPGKDIGYIGVSGGEAIMRPEWTRAIGAAKVNEMNAIARSRGVQGVQRYLGGFAGGGIIGGAWEAAKGGVGWVTEGVKGIVGSAKDFVVGNLRKAAEAMLNPLLDSLGDMPGIFGDLGEGLARKLAGGIFGMGDEGDAQSGLLEGGGFARSSSGWPKAVMGRLAANTRAAMDFVRETFAGIGGIGGLGQRSNKSDHPMGKAMDVMIPNWQDPSGVALGNRIASWFIQNPDAFGTKYVIWRDQINSGSGWRKYIHPSGNTTNPTLRHMDHPHISLYDQGGRLPTGLSQVMNATGRPELILNGQQESAIEAVLKGRLATMDATAGAVEFPDPDAWARQAARTFSRALIHERRGA